MFYGIYETSWGKEIKMRGFHNKVNKFNKTGALMFDSFYHVTLKKSCF